MDEDINRLERFSKLCKPLKDLALNWEVDIAEELDEYLIELDKVASASGSNLNYAQVAMVIQGSANVYSKKVEFLHELVYSHLNFLTSKAQSVKKKGKGVRGKQKSSKLFEAKYESYEAIKDAIAKKTSTSKEDNIKNSENDYFMPATLPTTANRLSGIVLNTLAYPFFVGGCLQTPEVNKEELFDLTEDADGRKILSHIYSLVHTGEETFEAARPQQDNTVHDLAEASPSVTNIDFQSFGEAESQGTVISDSKESDNDNWASIFDKLHSREWSDSTTKQKQKKYRKANYLFRPKRSRAEDFEKRLYKKATEWEGVFDGAMKNGKAMLHSTIGQELRSISSLERLKAKIKAGKTCFLDKARLEMLISLRDKIASKFETPHEDYQESVVSEEDFDLDIEDDLSEAEQEQRTSKNEINFNAFIEESDKARNSTTFNDFEEDQANTYPESYLELVKSHVQKYLAKAKQWAKESNIEDIVRNWQNRLRPILQEQSEHPDFDIHKYGKKVLKTLSKKSGPDSFQAVVKQQTRLKYETCRLFLATLQLANNGNVELQHSSNYSELNIKLLDGITMNEKLGESFK